MTLTTNKVYSAIGAVKRSSGRLATRISGLWVNLGRKPEIACNFVKRKPTGDTRRGSLIECVHAVMEEGFLTTEEVLDYLQVNLRTVYRLIKAGKIPAVRVGRQWRFRKNDIDAWLESQR